MMKKTSLRWFMALILVLNGLLVMSVSSAGAVTGDGQPGDANIKYFGRWDTSNLANVKSYWSGAYFRVNFTGTALSIKLAAATNIFAKIDNGADTYYAGANGTVNLTPTPLAAGTHTLRITAKSESDVIQFQGLILASGGTTQAPAARTKLIEFVGDSITAGCCALPNWSIQDYAWLTAEGLNADHTQIAYSGICLQNAAGCGVNNIGMSVQFFKLQTIDYPSSPNWDFTRYQPTQVVINIGTNDGGVSDATFQSTYTTYLQNVRVKYPNADIFVLRTFGGFKAAPTIAAVNARNSAGDSKVYYIDTNGWVTAGSSDFSDGLHPSVSGNVKIANRLNAVLTANRFESYNYPGNFMRHQAGRGKISSNLGALLVDSQFKMVTGLANAAAVSLESVNYPGFFLRHRNGEIWMDYNDGTALFKADASWYVRTGLANAAAKSLESYNYPGNYMRHYNGLLYSNAISTPLDQADATFFIR